MTMVPSHQQHHDLYGGYGGCGGGYTATSGYEYYYTLESDLVIGLASMAEDESKTNSLSEPGSSSKDVYQHDKDEPWLQLSIGGQTSHDTTKLHDQVGHRTGALIELDLLPASAAAAAAAASGLQQLRPIGASNIFHVPDFRPPPRPVANSFTTSPFSSFPHHEINWTFRPIPITHNITASASSSSSSSSSSLMPLGSYFTKPFQFHSGVDIAGPSSNMRIISPPRRPHSGIWFMLHASQNQLSWVTPCRTKEPFLPQIPRSYLRIKDGRMTVLFLMKYLVNKLSLDSESEIEIRCRGQQLEPLLTLQHVRDHIWNPRDVLTLLPDTSTNDHVMLLHYARIA